MMRHLRTTEILDACAGFVVSCRIVPMRAWRESFRNSVLGSMTGIYEVIVMIAARSERRRLIRGLAMVVAASLLPACASAPKVPPEARSQLAPTGKLRVGLLVGNPSYVRKDGMPDEMQGLGAEIGRELAKHLSVPFEPVRYKSVAALLEGGKRGEWNVAPIGYSRDRTAYFDFTAIYSRGQSKYLVPISSPIRSVADVDAPGNVVAVPRGSVQEQYVKQNLKRAQFVSVSVSEAIDMLKSGKAHALLNSGAVMNDAWLAKRPGFYLVEGGVGLGTGSALAVAKGSPAGLAYADEFVNHLKATGFVQQAIERNGLHGMSVP